MSSTPLMSLGLRAMTAAYAAMQTTGHNISNANVEGYSRQEVELATAKGQYTGAGFFGKGVDVKTVTRAHDEFLTRAAASAKSLSSMDSAREERLSQLQQIFPTGEGGIGYSMGEFLNSMVDLASRPGDSSTRQVVLARAQDLATRFNSAGSQLDQLQAGITSDLRTTVDTVNGLTSSLAAVNQQIAAVKGLGQPPNDLLDQRDTLLGQLSGYIQVTTVTADDGTVGVFAAGGQKLVLGTDSAKLKVTLDADDPSRSGLALVDSGNISVLDYTTLGGGSIAGLLRFQNEDLVDGRNLIGQMAAAVAGAVNQQQMLGINLQEPLGTVPSQPLFAVGAPLAVASTANAKDASGQYIASVSMTVTDASALQPYDYELRLDPDGSGQYQLTRLSDPPTSQLINSGDVVDGLQIDIGPNAWAATDRFRLKPVAQAASGMQALLTDPRDLAAASPLVATASPANTGTATVASLQMTSAPPIPDATARVTFTDDSGSYTWDLLDPSGSVLSSGSGTWSAQQPIPAASTDINGFQLMLSGVPRTGDVITVAPTPSNVVASNNGNALALASLRDVAFVGRTMTGSTTTGGTTATDAYAAAMSNIGVRVQSAKATSDISKSVSEQAEQARSSVSGVNLDEEAARLIQYQQSYQAAAKVLQVAQSVFETLLQTAAG